LLTVSWEKVFKEKMNLFIFPLKPFPMLNPAQQD